MTDAWEGLRSEIMGELLVLCPDARRDGRCPFMDAVPGRVLFPNARQLSADGAVWSRLSAEDLFAEVCPDGRIVLRLSRERVLRCLAAIPEDELPEPDVTEPEDPMFFAYFLHRRIREAVKHADGEMTFGPAAERLDWEILRMTHLIRSESPGGTAQRMRQLRELWEAAFAEGTARQTVRLGIMDSLVCEAAEKLRERGK